MATTTGEILSRLRMRLDRTVGGPQRRRVIVVFAVVLALDSADKSTIGTNATQLQDALGIGRPQIGLLLAVNSLVGALAAVPAGALVDRTNRSRLLSYAVAAWAVAMALSAVSPSFLFLLLTRLLLGALTAVAGPAIASMVGDYFPEGERGRVYGYILSGELLGAGLGFMVSGQLALISWRVPFAALVLPGVAVWWLVHRLPEPARDGSDRLVDLGADARQPDEEDVPAAYAVVEDQEIEPRDELMPSGDLARLPLLKAVRYVLSVRTNCVLIIASALGYFFFTGIRGFAVEFEKRQYGVGQSVASSLMLLLGIGALVGVLLGGHVADVLMRRGRVSARVTVPGVAVILAAVVFVPAFLTESLLTAAVLLSLAAACLGAANPPLDAARLDIMPPGLWGRAEAVRTFLRNGADAAAPILFGVVSTSVFGGSTGLRDTFLLALLTLIAAGAVALLIGRRTYPQDVATAAASAERR